MKLNFKKIRFKKIKIRFKMKKTGLKNKCKKIIILKIELFENPAVFFLPCDAQTILNFTVRKKIKETIIGFLKLSKVIIYFFLFFYSFFFLFMYTFFFSFFFFTFFKAFEDFFNKKKLKRF